MATFTLVVASSHPQDAIPEPSPCRYATVWKRSLYLKSEGLCEGGNCPVL